MTVPRVERAPRRRGAFGLDERRFIDPRRVETELRDFLTQRLPEVWLMATPPGPTPVVTPAATADRQAEGRTLALLLPRGHVVVLRIERDPARLGPESRRLADRCRAMGIPHATVSNLAEGRAALRRLGVEPRPASPAGRTPDAVFGGR